MENCFSMISCVTEEYGEEDGKMLLSYLHTYINELLPYRKFELSCESHALSVRLAKNMFREFGSNKIAECIDFLMTNYNNHMLLNELSEHGDEYVLPEVLFAKQLCRVLMDKEKNSHIKTRT